MYPRVGEKRRIDDINIEDEEAIGSLCRLSGRPVSPKSAMEQEKRIRREIANSNERRRMQSINAGFASLKTLLPHHEGEKLSKAAILQQTAEYIYQLEQERTRLLSQNCQFKRLLNQQHSDQEGSPTGGDSPSEDRSISASTPPPPSNVTTTTLATPLPVIATVGNGDAILPEEIRREMVDTRMNLDRERRQRHKLEEHIRGLEAEIYPEKTKDVSHQVNMDYCSLDSQPCFKIEVKDENISPSVSPPSQMVSASIKMEADQADFGEGMKGIYFQKTLLKTGTNGITSHVALPVTTPANLCTTNVPNATMIRTSCARNSTISSSPTTIVTVLPSNKANNKALPPILELRGVSEVDATEVCSPSATVEYVDEEGTVLRNNRTVVIVNPGNSCQKSLDTICEAIRHLEGDHMFSSEEQSGGPGIEEEIVTEETFTVEEDMSHHNVPPDLHQHHPPNIIRNYDSQGNNHPSLNGSSSSPSSIHSSHVNHHPLGMGHLTLHMIQPEPQEVPLELTTTHRVSNQPQYASRDMSMSSAEQTISSHSTNLLSHSSRPGVIVVKHQ